MVSPAVGPDEGALFAPSHVRQLAPIVIVEVFDKKARATPKVVVETCKNRLRRYDAV